MTGSWREDSFTGDPERYVKALEWVCVSIRAPLLGNMEERSFLWAFEIKIYIKRDVKCPVSSYLSPQGPCWGTWKGFACRDFLRERIVYLGSFLGPEDIDILSLGTIWNFGKRTGFS